jgi:peroxiredoxin
LEQHHHELTAAGLQVVSVALGEPKHAERYCGELAPSQTCLASTTNDPYYTWGLYQYTAKDMIVNGIKLLSATQKAKSAGHTQGKATGDVAMSTGTFIIDRQGVVRYAYYGAYAGDDPDIHLLLEAAQSLPQGA